MLQKKNTYKFHDRNISTVLKRGMDCSVSESSSNRLRIIRRFAITFIVVLIAYAVNPGVSARARIASEYEIKAAFIYNFVLFTRWPEPVTVKTGDMVVGIVGRDPFGNFFSKVEGKSIGGKGKILKVLRFGTYRDSVDLSKCNILFISSSEKYKVKSILGKLKGLPVLTVADTAGFLEAGGMINLVVKANRVRWEINKAPLDYAGLRLNAQLFKSAVKVVGLP